MIERTLILLFIFLWSGAAFGAHPLITDDTGTQGKGRFQIEINGEYSVDKVNEAGITVREKASELSATLAYGITDNLDIMTGIPYQWYNLKEDNITMADENGSADISLEVKWRFYDKEGVSLALKPGVTLPTGDESKGLGSGKVTYGILLIGSKESGPFAFHVDLGYTRNDNKADERRDIWHTHIAGIYEAVKDIRFVANIGTEENPDRGSNALPVFVLGGLIYSIAENLDVDFGIKAGLNRPETDYAVLAGLAVRF